MVHLIPSTRHKPSEGSHNLMFDIRISEESFFNKLLFSRFEIDYMGKDPLKIHRDSLPKIDRWLLSNEDHYLIVEMDFYTQWLKYFMEKGPGKFTAYTANSEEEPIKAAFFLANKSYMMSLYSKAHIRPFKQRLK
ncbi:MAG: hypothetical protein ACI88L_000186 [Candidatus Paceibacteria bacterium]|jgi:hypothetical protein